VAVSVFDLFKIGIGPSSSHTVGPMKAACGYVGRLQRNGQLEATRRLRVSLYGSLAHTGRGHGTDKAVMLGLQGEFPDRIDPDRIAPMLEGGLLTITAARTNGFLTVVLEDNGAGIQEGYTKRGIGIKNVIARLNMVYGPGNWCRITSDNGGGTRVEIRFPLKERILFEDKK